MSSGTPVPYSVHISSPSPHAFDLILGECLRRLGRRPAGLISDIDGTLSPIVARPQDAAVDSSIRTVLEGLVSRLDLVAVITGREEAVARRMVGAAGITYVGNYGLLPGSKVEGLTEIAEARAEAEALLTSLPCVEIEGKGVGFSLHYRNCDDPDSVRVRILNLVSPLAARANAKVVEGKKVIELVPANLPDKRSAFLHLIDQAALSGLVYIGDDLSDVAVFEEIAALRKSGRIDGLAIAVTDAETDFRVREASDFTLGSVEDVGRLLAMLAQELTEGQR